MEDKTKELNMEDLNLFAKMINTGSPAHIVDFDEHEELILIGYYLLSMDDDKFNEQFTKSLILPKKDTEIIVFESRHMIEVSNIIYGILLMLYNQNKNVALNSTVNIIDILKNNNMRLYRDIKKALINNCNDSILLNINNEKCAHRICDIICNIWFLPYSQTDCLLKMAYNEIKKAGVTNNE